MIALSYLILRLKRPDWERPFKVKLGVRFHIYAKIMQKKEPEKWKPIVLEPKDIKNQNV